MRKSHSLPRGRLVLLLSKFAVAAHLAYALSATSIGVAPLAIDRRLPQGLAALRLQTCALIPCSPVTAYWPSALKSRPRTRFPCWHRCRAVDEGLSTDTSHNLIVPASSQAPLTNHRLSGLNPRLRGPVSAPWGCLSPISDS